MVRKILPCLVFFVAGAAALSWQVLWHLDLSLALGVSARGTALTVATVMAGMTLGALWSGNRLEMSPSRNPWIFYGVLELLVGILAWLPQLLMPLIEGGDAAVYRSLPYLASPFSALMLALTIGPSSFAMGATLPVIGILARRSGTLLSRFYAINTAGAAVGSLVVAFFLLPAFGRTGSGILLVLAQLILLGIACLLGKREIDLRPEGSEERGRDGGSFPEPLPASTALLFVGATGFAAFSLEVSWFRLLRSAWLSTTDSFAIMLFVFLVSLAVGAWVSKKWRQMGVSLAVLLFLAAIAIWIGTPLLERFDTWGTAGGSYFGRILGRVLAALLVMGPAVILMGISLPWLLDEAKSPREWAKRYGINTIGAVLGSIVTGWVLITALGPVRASWLAGGVLAVVALPFIRSWRARAELFVPGVMILAAAWWLNSGVGVTRVQGPTKLVRESHQLISNVNGPDVTTSVVRTKEGATVLFIDGYAATGEFGARTDYMDAMGRLPMLLHTQPRDALVICFGTGRTARAVLDENPERLTVVDVNPAVFELADDFIQSNRGVLKDDRVRFREMDGRAWLRRAPDEYDVVTLEPMPPFFAGVNSLYSVEFYNLISNRLREGGFVAQWFPMHLLTPEHSKAVAAAFVHTFPNAILWMDPDNLDANGAPQQGILIGRKGEREWDRWPGFQRPSAIERPLTFDQVNDQVFLTREELAAYVAGVEPVTDDNQILSYDSGGLHRQDLSERFLAGENLAEILQVKERLDSAGEK